MWGDGKPSYKVDEIEAWLRNDLAIASRKAQPVMLLTHGIYDTNIYDMRHLYDRTKIVTMGSRPLDVMAACDFRAIIHGHLHKNYFRRTDDLRVEVVSVAPPMKDFSTLQVVGVDADRRLHVENRYGHGKPWPGSSTPPPGGWLAQVQGNVFYGAPCVAAGRVFAGTIDPEGKGRAGAYALDAATGRRLWSFKTRSDVLTRVLFAAFVSAVTRPFGVHGLFYKICGKGVAGIDGFYFRSSFDRYKELALINPPNPVELCDALEKDTGVPTVLMDANDIDQNQLGKCSDFPLTDEEIQEAMADNPSGQGDELTPLILIRPLNA